MCEKFCAVYGDHKHTFITFFKKKIITRRRCGTWSQYNLYQTKLSHTNHHLSNTFDKKWNNII
jgi:hypothetical protein